MLEGALSVSLRSLPSQALRASSPAGRAKRTPVNRGKLCGKATLLQLCLTTYFANTNARALGSPCGGAGTGCASALCLRGEQTNNAGAGFRQPPQRDPIFRDAKVLLFWCDQQQKEHWLDIPLCRHIGWVYTRALSGLLLKVPYITPAMVPPGRYK